MKVPGIRGKWLFSVDRGGTFTDVIGVDPDRNVHTAKLLSQSPNYPDAAIEGIRRTLGVSEGDPLPENLITGIRMGTTVATNALLEREGTLVALLITKGFRDLLEIGYQSRPEIFKLAIKKPAQLYRCVKEVDERIDHSGKIRKKIDLEIVEEDLLRIQRMGISSVAIVLMHAWKNNSHERKVADLARKLGFKQVSASHEIMPLIKIVGRGQTSVVDAYLSPVLWDYIESVRKHTGKIPLEFMQSSGGMTDADSFMGKDAIISGPAGGVIGSAIVAKLNGIKECIGFDMGGTSTDVSRWDGTFEKTFEVQTGGIRFQAPSLKVNTVAAGGGSILWFDGQRFRVGPESAGADPGPACYGRGGPLTVTDANLLLGRILPDYFPATFGTGQDKPLDGTATQKKFGELTASISERLNTKLTPIEVALGFVKVANETMAKAVREISISRGYDVRRHGLICLGGAAPQHMCAIARILGVQEIVIHPLVGLLSAYGIARANHLRYAIQSIVKTLDRALMQSIEDQFEHLEKPLIEELVGRGTTENMVETRRFLDIRPLGTDTYLSIPFAGSLRDTSQATIERKFLKAYREHFGFKPSGAPLELVNIWVEAAGKGDIFKDKRQKIKDRSDQAMPVEFVDVHFEKKATATPVYRREECSSGQQIEGPAIIAEDYSTVVVEPGFFAAINDYGHIVVKPRQIQVETVSAKRDPVMLEVFNHLFMSVAEQMGYTLKNAAHSTNIKERLDFSCAIFDLEGNLVANAPHIPVHLGAMGESVTSIIGTNMGKMKPGDVYVMNNPHRGGTHLPDITVVAPVFLSSRPTFFTAARGHHADIGGITPGSMPPFATKIKEEGVVIDNFLLVHGGRFREKEIRELLLSGSHPARNIEERISDLKAQIAAVNAGIRELKRLVEKYSLDTVHAYMNHVRENAAEAMREALGKFLTDTHRFESRFEDFLDEGARIAVKLIIERGDDPPHSHRALIDFSGTEDQLASNLNAPVSVTTAAVLYVLRALIDEDIPLNSGCLLPMEIHVRKGSLLDPSPEAAVVGGNVETSQRIVDVLLGALGVVAASQGTMNNFLFGRPDGSGKQYYETIAGGSGAGDGFPGASAVQIHMTNTRITDPEVLEQRYPEIRLERFSLRRGSGGKGAYRGGDGTIREFRFLEPRTVSILSERRKYPPYGMKGGKPGVKGKNILLKADGSRRLLGGKAEFVVGKNDRIIIKTPGGGGFGRR